MYRDHAILLLKPDAFDRGHTAGALDLCKAAGLKVRCGHRVRIDDSNISALSPECTEDDVVERLLRECQYSGRLIEIILVSGEGALDRALEVRREARKRWALGPFSNVVHAADDAAEWSHQLQALVPACLTCQAACGEVTGPYQRKKLSLYLPQTVRDETALRNLVREMWEDCNSPVWNPRAIEVCPDGTSGPWTHEVILEENYRIATVDGLMMAILVALPDLAIETAMRAVVAAAHHRRSTLTVSTPKRAGEISATFEALGLKAFTRMRPHA